MPHGQAKMGFIEFELSVGILKTEDETPSCIAELNIRICVFNYAGNSKYCKHLFSKTSW